jgi:hypothetical protein
MDVVPECVDAEKWNAVASGVSSGRPTSVSEMTAVAAAVLEKSTGQHAAAHDGTR